MNGCVCVCVCVNERANECAVVSSTALDGTELIPIHRSACRRVVHRITVGHHMQRLWQSLFVLLVLVLVLVLIIILLLLLLLIIIINDS